MQILGLVLEEPPHRFLILWATLSLVCVAIRVPRPSFWLEHPSGQTAAATAPLFLGFSQKICGGAGVSGGR